MVVLVDIDTKRAQAIAEKIRTSISQEKFELADGSTINITVSIGISVYSGHPDYQFDLTNADKALYQAKQQGRNRAILSSS